MFVHDVFLYAALFIIGFLYVFQRHVYKVLHNVSMIIYPPTWSNRRQQDAQIALAASSYMQHSCLAHRELSRMRNSYSAMGRQHKRIGYDLGYTNKLNTLAETIHVNAIITRKLSEMAGENSNSRLKNSTSNAAQNHQQLSQIRDVLKQFVREWSVEGTEERSRTFAPILDVLMKATPQRREDTTVLVPGSGLGRLAWEIANMGVKLLTILVSTPLAESHRNRI
jgi:ribosomal protein S20